MKNANISLKSPLPGLAYSARKLRPYVGLSLFVLFASVYGFVIFKINTLSNPSVDSSAVIAGAKGSPALRIDPDAAKQLEGLKDNSVNVQTLFEQNRTNPFQE